MGPLRFVPHDPGTEQHCHHSHSYSSHKRDQAWVKKGTQAQAGNNQQVDGDPDGSIALATREPSMMDQRLPLTHMEIAQSVHWDRPPRMLEGIPPEEVRDQDPLLVMGSSLVSTHLFMDPLSGSMYIDMVACPLSLVSLDPSPMAVGDCLVPAPEDTTDSDWWPRPFTVNTHFPSGRTVLFWHSCPTCAYVIFWFC